MAAERLTELVLGLQRMAENARLRGDDLRYVQQQDTDEHVQYLDQLLEMLGRARGVLLEERKKFMPVAETVTQLAERQAKAIGRSPA